MWRHKIEEIPSMSTNGERLEMTSGYPVVYIWLRAVKKLRVGVDWSSESKILEDKS